MESNDYGLTTACVEDCLAQAIEEIRLAEAQGKGNPGTYDEDFGDLPIFNCVSTEMMKTRCDLDIPHVGALMGIKVESIVHAAAVARDMGGFITPEDVINSTDEVFKSGFGTVCQILEMNFAPAADPETQAGNYSAPYYHLVSSEMDQIYSGLTGPLKIACYASTEREGARTLTSVKKAAKGRLYELRFVQKSSIHEDFKGFSPHIVLLDRYLSEVYLTNSWHIHPSFFGSALRRLGFFFDLDTVRLRQNVKEPHAKPSMMIRQFDPYMGPAGAAVVEVHVRHKDKDYDRVFLDYVVPPDSFKERGWATETTSARAYVGTRVSASVAHRMKYLDLEPLRLVTIRKAGMCVPPAPFPSTDQWSDLAICPFPMTDTNRGKAFGPVDLLYHPLGPVKYGIKWDGVEAELRSTGSHLYYSLRDGTCRFAKWDGPNFRLQLEHMERGPPIVVDVLDAPSLSCATFSERWAWVDTFVSNWLGCPYGLQEWYDECPRALPNHSDGVVVQPADAPPGRWGMYGTARYLKTSYTIDAAMGGHVAEFTLDGKHVRDRPDKAVGNPPETVHDICEAITLADFQAFNALLDMDQDRVFPNAWRVFDTDDPFEERLRGAEPLFILACLHPRFVNYHEITRRPIFMAPHSNKLPEPIRFRSWLIERMGKAVQEAVFPDWLLEVWKVRPVPPTLDELDILAPPPSGFLTVDDFDFNVPDDEIEVVECLPSTST